MFRSSNVHGWPQIVLGVYGLTMFGGDVVRGYGCTHVPTLPGRYTKYVQLYTPVSSSCLQRVTAWVMNNPPEFFDSKFIAQGKGREVTRVRSHGCVKVTFNVTTKNMAEWGYSVGGERTLTAAPDALLSGASGGGYESSRPGSPSRQATLGGPSRTALSSQTVASLARARSQTAGISAAINPPSAQGSRESSRLGRATSTAVTSGEQDEFESKYPMSAATGSQQTGLSQRASPAMRPTQGTELGVSQPLSALGPVRVRPGM
jgi:hypothetical protein